MIEVGVGSVDGAHLNSNGVRENNRQGWEWCKTGRRDRDHTVSDLFALRVKKWSGDHGSD